MHSANPAIRPTFAENQGRIQNILNSDQHIQYKRWLNQQEWVRSTKYRVEHFQKYMELYGKTGHARQWRKIVDEYHLTDETEIAQVGVEIMRADIANAGVEAGLALHTVLQGKRPKLYASKRSWAVMSFIGSGVPLPKTPWIRKRAKKASS